eukprot:TRINITY_DN10280_c0_g1_i2.p1 TRINITY_DN10280_c0_g1~~TRINITY_DN10280_c0_g1_i2.p1  ORF type:complete len:360 (-),score=86.94 TRINITY_DN10280_c0_g1_i2:334-1344(-)
MDLHLHPPTPPFPPFNQSLFQRSRPFSYLQSTTNSFFSVFSASKLSAKAKATRAESIPKRRRGRPPKQKQSEDKDERVKRRDGKQQKQKTKKKETQLEEMQVKPQERSLEASLGKAVASSMDPCPTVGKSSASTKIEGKKGEEEEEEAVKEEDVVEQEEDDLWSSDDEELIDGRWKVSASEYFKEPRIRNVVAEDGTLVDWEGEDNNQVIKEICAAEWEATVFHPSPLVVLVFDRYLRIWKNWMALKELEKAFEIYWNSPNQLPPRTVKVDAKADVDLASALRVQYTPEILFLAGGKLLYRETELRTAEELVEMIAHCYYNAKRPEWMKGPSYTFR